MDNNKTKVEKKLSNCVICAKNKRHRQHLLPIMCRCGKTYCIRHFRDHEYECTFNYHDENFMKEQLKRGLDIEYKPTPKVTGI